jgi:hypothetical protein
MFTVRQKETFVLGRSGWRPNVSVRPRPWASKVIAIAHYAKAFDLHFILNSHLTEMAVGTDYERNENLSKKFEHPVFLDSVSDMPLPLSKVPEAFGLMSSKSWYHYFNTEEHLDYIGVIPIVSYYGASEMRDSERREFLEWYEGQKDDF